MQVVRVIPCLDVDDGRVVKGVNFLDLTDEGDPVELASRYDAQGADELVFLDITASHHERNTMIDVVSRTAESVFIPLTVGGGVRSVEDARALLRAGADKVAINSAALARPELITEIAHEFGSQCVVLAVDARLKSEGAWTVYSHGGRTDTERDLLAWIREGEQRGAGELLLTSMDRDGTKLGFDLSMLAMAAKMVHIPLIASGGVGELEHFAQGASLGGATGLLAASVFHRGTFSIGQVKEALLASGITVRPS
ncbi:MAG: imidazole glycerol phosphate synthase subunit HisF [Actinobacteria bacterium]|nr:imidazole glycerol phosphate synthase subunit HisF [Actinomycetota bacterium]